jgi:hypothetical protein
MAACGQLSIFVVVYECDDIIFSFRLPKGGVALALDYASQGDLFNHLDLTSTSPVAFWKFAADIVCVA